MKPSTVMLLAAVALVAVMFLANDEKAAEREAAAELSLYCDMVEIRLQYGEQYGWPDYRGIYKTECGR